MGRPILLLALWLGGCGGNRRGGDDDDDDDADGDSDSDADSDGDADADPEGAPIALAVEETSFPDRLDDSRPAADRAWLVVRTSIDDTADRSISLAALLFSVEADGGLLYPALERAGLEGPCEAEWRLAPGGHHECELAFEVPAETTLTTLWYDDGAFTARAPLGDIESPASTAPICEDVRLDEEDCMDCASSAGCGIQVETEECAQCFESGHAFACQCSREMGASCEASYGDFLECVVEECPAC